MVDNTIKKLIGRIFETVLDDSVEAVVQDFRKTNLYSEAFLSDLAEELRKSSHLRRIITKNNNII